ncbi:MULTISPECIES: signal peptide peptidase SppA [Aeromonas]|uniref:Signal peptide peptidase SppA n=1 Tax=Aeromonas caviae TaxID=648 RepID=A0A3S5WQX8_AERCA|nr:MULTISPECIES: signal peptide peptidase SppA [Aeromonas]AXB04213.1 signal peptide peptidase SppA [Aeromonas caviae]AXB07608.1 signal peptide peptidase SppA [Aeromonas caviae]MBL0437300.1 signal peptide peptidase SppA [Aeromonas caviae]MBL0650638.1 signal peptide peptidase SppA [Aeromonas caviae]QXB96834.1 signal peptide peptidase SppA [Aeromonas sp. FDAARGOS 1406]
MSIFKGLGWLFRSLWRLLNFTRLMLVNLLFLLVVLVIVFSVSQSETPSTPIEGALTLNLSGVLVEQRTQTDPTVQLLRQMDKGDEQPSEIVLSDLLWAIKSAGNDDRIKALVIKPQGLQGTSLSKLQEVTAAIDAFKESGKPVIAMADYYSQGAYLLAAHADHVLLNQSGAVLIEGLGVYQTYFKSALEKLNITPHVFKVGTYKSFVEPYTRDEMSPESKEANQRWLDQLWQSYVADVAEQREIEPDAVAPNKDHFLELLRKAGGNAASYALDNGLVDQLATRDEMTQAVIKEVGEADDHGWKGVGLKEYLAAIPEQYPQSGKDEVGLITASGAIMDGVQPAGTIGGDSLADLLAEARRDDQVKAVVLRVDSPGGSAFAAEQIRAELLALKQAGKPVVISMGSYAASGGYWISADADKIFASPTTLTGSIGVFGMFATIDKALSQYGVHTDGVGTTDFVGIGLTRALPDHVGEAIQLSVEDTYQRFVGLVGKGRGLSPEEAEKAAEGRVWTGQDAKALGLVDEFGNLDDALKAAADLANLKSWQVTPIAPEESARDKFLRELFDSSAQALAPHLQSWLPTGLGKTLLEMNRTLDPLTRFNDPQGTYAFCPVCLP